jgi:hypothetical protein
MQRELETTSLLLTHSTVRMRCPPAPQVRLQLPHGEVRQIASPAATGRAAFLHACVLHFELIGGGHVPTQLNGLVGLVDPV